MLAIKPFSYETEALEGYTTQIFRLKSVTPTRYSKLENRATGDTDVYRTLAYSFDSDYKTHGPLMPKPTLRNVISPMVFGVEIEVASREALRLLREVVSDMDSDSYYADPASKHVTDKLNMVRRAFSYLGYTELSSLVNSVWENNEESTIK